MPGPLRRMLRGLAAEGVLAELPDGRFGLTPVGDLLREDVAGSLRGAALARGDLYFPAAADLLVALRTGAVPFEAVAGTSFFAQLATRPDLTASFQASMANRSRQEAAAVVAAYDFGRFRRLLDVGGGSGVLLAEVLQATPGLHGTLLDRPEVTAAARERLAALGVGDRSEVVAGDFFGTLPPGHDAILLSRVLHDWDDADAGRILAACRRAIAPDGRLLVVEAILPERAADLPAAIRMDLHMLLLFRGRERTEAEFGQVLADVGFRLARVVPTGLPAGVAVVEAEPVA